MVILLDCQIRHLNIQNISVKGKFVGSEQVTVLRELPRYIFRNHGNMVAPVMSDCDEYRPLCLGQSFDSNCCFTIEFIL